METQNGSIESVPLIRRQRWVVWQKKKIIKNYWLSQNQKGVWMRWKSISHLDFWPHGSAQNLPVCHERVQIQHYSKYLATPFFNELFFFLRLTFVWIKPSHRQEKRSFSGFDRAFSSQVGCWEIFNYVISNLNLRLKI